MLNNSKNELKALDLALVVLEAWFDGHDKIDTVFGEQYTVNGYQLESIQFLYYIEKNEIKLQE